MKSEMSPALRKEEENGVQSRWRSSSYLLYEGVLLPIFFCIPVGGRGVHVEQPGSSPVQSTRRGSLNTHSPRVNVSSVLQHLPSRGQDSDSILLLGKAGGNAGGVEGCSCKAFTFKKHLFLLQPNSAPQWWEALTAHF